MASAIAKSPLLLVMVLSVYQASACDTGWFGSKCQYKCHCTDNNCYTDGSCVNNSTCQHGWFGTACQYANLVTSAKLQIFTDNGDKNLLSDDNDQTCHKSLRVAILTWQSNYAFSWIRLVTDNAEEHNSNITVRLKPFKDSDTWYYNHEYMSCDHETRYVVDKRTIDILCELQASVHEVMLEGHGIKSMCSVYISEGRNLALKQQAWQSSTYTDFDKSKAANAVDGNTDGDYDHGSCTHTGIEDVRGRPAWQITFPIPVIIRRTVIYNRATCCQGRLQGFELRTFTTGDEVANSYEEADAEAMDKYAVLFLKNSHAISKLKILAKRRPNTQVFLNLCEVEVFGDWLCPIGKYGLDCEQTCNCADVSEQCLVNTGVCHYGCAAGYQGEGCREECDPGHWGLNCSHTCHEGCLNSSCDKVTGQCYRGCSIGYIQPDCLVGCPEGTWGANCSNICHDNCLEGSCDKFNGACDSGCEWGFQSSSCNETCINNFWGGNCSIPCPTGCFNETCDSLTGHCQLGCEKGFSGPNCTEVCALGYWGENCYSLCRDTCGSDQCDSVTGQCLESTIIGTGATPTCPRGPCPAYRSALALTASMLSLVIVILLVIIMAQCWDRRERSSKYDLARQDSEAEKSLMGPTRNGKCLKQQDLCFLKQQDLSSPC